jgi:hypothetical protein
MNLAQRTKVLGESFAIIAIDSAFLAVWYPMESAFEHFVGQFKVDSIPTLACLWVCRIAFPSLTCLVIVQHALKDFMEASRRCWAATNGEQQPPAQGAASGAAK